MESSQGHHSHFCLQFMTKDWTQLAYSSQSLEKNLKYRGLFWATNIERNRTNWWIHALCGDTKVLYGIENDLQTMSKLFLIYLFRHVSGTVSSSLKISVILTRPLHYLVVRLDITGDWE